MDPPRARRPRTIGILGAGRSGVAITRLALEADCTLKIASSGPLKDN